LHRFAVISDVHANLEALEKVIEQAGWLEIYCLGDFVDYGANPNEVIDRVRKREVKSLMGNHDSAVLSGDTSQFNARAAMSSQWSARQLTMESREYLLSLPSEIRVKVEGAEFYFTHGSPDDRLWEYVDPRTHANIFSYYLNKTKSKAMGLGHTHIPYVWKEGSRVVFNPGSVGQPRDGDRRASFAIVSVNGGEVKVEERRVEYDFEEAGAKIREAGLPVSFADRLETGT